MLMVSLNGEDEMVEYMTQREVQSALVDLLDEFDSLCQRFELHYSLFAGTLLGAVRHKGFIPWDDDLDVCMPRPDFERLLSLSREMPDGYELISNRNSPFVYPFAKFLFKGVRAQEETYEGLMDEYLWLDVFPLDGVDSDAFNREKRTRKIARLIKLRIQGSLCPTRGGVSGAKAFLRAARKSLICTMYPLRTLDKKIEQEITRISFEECEYVSNLSIGFSKSWAVSKEEAIKYSSLEFEGRKYPVFEQWDSWLSTIYGDYMQLPPVHERVAHGIKAWRV